MQPVPFDPRQGSAFQGDVVIMPIPGDLSVSRSDEVPMRGDMLVLAEGEVTGHHHAHRYGLAAVARFHDEGLARRIETKAEVGTTRLFRDPATTRELCRRGILTTDDLCVGFLVVEGDCPPLTHDEHAPIHIPPGTYYVGAKREQDAADVRRIAD